MKTKTKTKFYKILLLIVLLFMVAICVGAVYFWRYIEAYEISRHEHIIEKLQENIDYDFWEKKAEEAIAARLTEFETDAEAALKPHLALIRDAQYSLRYKSGESTDEELVYAVRAGMRDIGTVRLAVSGSAGYDFNLWEVRDIEFLDSFVDTFFRDISITVSQNAQVEVNSIPVSQEYRIDCDIEHGATYSIKGICGETEVSVAEFDGRISDPYYAENGVYHYPVIIPFSRNYVITVPEGVEIFVDSERVAAEHITNDKIVPSIFDEIAATNDALPYMVRYEFELGGLYIEPVVTAADTQGRELIQYLSEDGETVYNTAYSLEYKEEYSATVEAFIRAYVSYGANIGSSVESNFNRVAGLMLHDTDLYRRVMNSRHQMEWVIYATVVYNSLEIDNFRPYGEDFFTCEVQYDITNKTGYEVREVKGHYELLFVRSSSGKWLAARMISL